MNNFIFLYKIKTLIVIFASLSLSLVTPLPALGVNHVSSDRLRIKKETPTRTPTLEHLAHKIGQITYLNRNGDPIKPTPLSQLLPNENGPGFSLPGITQLATDNRLRTNIPFSQNSQHCPSFSGNQTSSNRKIGGSDSLDAQEPDPELVKSSGLTLDDYRLIQPILPKTKDEIREMAAEYRPANYQLANLVKINISFISTAKREAKNRKFYRLSDPSKIVNLQGVANWYRENMKSIKEIKEKNNINSVPKFNNGISLFYYK